MNSISFPQEWLENQKAGWLCVWLPHTDIEQNQLLYISVLLIAFNWITNHAPQFRSWKSKGIIIVHDSEGQASGWDCSRKVHFCSQSASAGRTGRAREGDDGWASPSSTPTHNLPKVSLGFLTAWRPQQGSQHDCPGDKEQLSEEEAGTQCLTLPHVCHILWIKTEAVQGSATIKRRRPSPPPPWEEHQSVRELAL